MNNAEFVRVRAIGKQPLRPAVFLDRDGVLNRPPDGGGYILSPAELQLNPGVVDFLKCYSNLGYRLIVATNQSCIAKGLLSLDQLAEIHRRLHQLLKQAGTQVDAVYYCPHQDQDKCRCRKPLPGMLLQAAQDWNLDLTKSLMIGDSERDLVAGRAAGCISMYWNSSPEFAATCLQLLVRRSRKRAPGEASAEEKPGTLSSD